TNTPHFGRTEQAGVLAPRLAKSAFPGPPDALEHSAGFMRAHSPSATPKVDLGNWHLGREWRLPKYGINIKRYPMCYATHRSIDAMLDLVHDHNLSTDAVGEVHVRIGNIQSVMLRNHDPKTALEAKFSLEFAMACAIVARRVGLAELDDAFVRRADVIENMRKVKYTTTDETLPDMPFAREETLSIVLKSGETITHPPVTRPKGSWQKPLSDDELRDKFTDCAKIGLGQQGADSAFRRMNGIERLASLRDLPLVTRV